FLCRSSKSFFFAVQLFNFSPLFALVRFHSKCRVRVACKSWSRSNRFRAYFRSSTVVNVIFRHITKTLFSTSEFVGLEICWFWVCLVVITFDHFNLHPCFTIFRKRSES
ncbi:hypothetical protein PFISCL1PPCAC_7592, partial [Pristionchus fissidentatus]